MRGRAALDVSDESGRGGGRIQEMGIDREERTGRKADEVRR